MPVQNALQPVVKLHHVMVRWFHVVRFQKLNQTHKKWVHQQKREKLHDAILNADQADRAYDSFALFQTVNKFTPKSRKRRVQLRHADATIASPIQELQILRQFVQQTWTCPPFAMPSPDHAPGVPLSHDDLVAAFASIKPMKGVNPDSAPGLPWHVLAEDLVFQILPLLKQWWTTAPPHIPRCWRLGHLYMLPKPGKGVHKVDHLRPLALTDPIGKAILGALTRKALDASRHVLCQWPQVAFLPHRSALDAIRRVVCHASSIQELACHHRLSIHQKASGQKPPQLSGGFQVHLELSKAFDSAQRDQIFDQRTKLPVHSSIQHLRMAWHEQTFYRFGVGDLDGF